MNTRRSRLLLRKPNEKPYRYPVLGDLRNRPASIRVR
jgi:hypothetical protein